MKTRVHFYSYFKEIAGCSEVDLELPLGSSVGDLMAVVHSRFPQLAPMARSTLVAVGMEYQSPEYRLHEGQEVSLFPPVQGG
jgi:molybdopterin converting factor small subunit